MTTSVELVPLEDEDPEDREDREDEVNLPQHFQLNMNTASTSTSVLYSVSMFLHFWFFVCLFCHFFVCFSED